jgi:hypothetical protein
MRKTDNQAQSLLHGEDFQTGEVGKIMFPYVNRRMI